MYETILSPVNYGGLQLKNRIIFAPTTFGLPDEEYLAEIRRLAEGGCAMLIIGDVPVGKSRFEKSLTQGGGNTLWLFGMPALFSRTRGIFRPAVSLMNAGSGGFESAMRRFQKNTPTSSSIGGRRPQSRLSV